MHNGNERIDCSYWKGRDKKAMKIERKDVQIAFELDLHLKLVGPWTPHRQLFIIVQRGEGNYLFRILVIDTSARALCNYLCKQPCRKAYIISCRT